jgi:hypothetical protein
MGGEPSSIMETAGKHTPWWTGFNADRSALQRSDPVLDSEASRASEAPKLSRVSGLHRSERDGGFPRPGFDLRFEVFDPADALGLHPDR